MVTINGKELSSTNENWAVLKLKKTILEYTNWRPDLYSDEQKAELAKEKSVVFEKKYADGDRTKAEIAEIDFKWIAKDIPREIGITVDDGSIQRVNLETLDALITEMQLQLPELRMHNTPKDFITIRESMKLGYYVTENDILESLREE